MNSNCTAKTAQLQTEILRWIQKHYVKRYLTLRYMENLYRKTRMMNLHLFSLNESRLKNSAWDKHRWLRGASTRSVISSNSR